MADVKISQLPAATTPLAGTEEVPLVQSGTTKKVTVANLRGATGVTAVTGTAGRITSTGGTTPAIDLASGVATPGTTGSSTLIPVVTVDTYGRVTSVTTAANPQGTVTSVTGTAPVVSSGGATPAISMAAANTSTDGYLTSTDWNTFNGKGSGTVTGVTATSPVVSSGGAAPVISMPAANTSTNGYLTSTDWNTFNGKQPAGSYLTSGGALGTPSSGTATNLTGLPLTTGVTGLLPIANGGTGTATPALVAGTNVTITGTWPNQTIAATGGGGSGTVTSVAATVPAFLAVTGSPITTSGTLAIDYSGTALPLANGGTAATTAAGARTSILPAYAGNAGKVLAVNSGATDVEYIAAGGTGTVTSVDVSGGTTGLTTSGGPITTAGTVTLAGTLAIANGGTGQTTRQAAMDALAGAVTAGQYLRGDGTDVVMSAIQAADVPTLNQNTTGTATNVTGTVAIANGGTGQTTAAAAITALTGTQTSGQYLRSDGTNAALAAIQAADVPTLNQNTTGTAANVTGIVAIANGGTGTTTPALVAGTNVTITGSWPNQTINSSGGGGGSVTISNDTSTATNIYPLFADATTGSLTTAYTSNAKYLYQPSTGTLSASQVNASNGIFVNNATLQNSYTIPAGSNAMTAGPFTVPGGMTVTVSGASRWVVI